MEFVAEIFNSEWCISNQSHPVCLYMNARGLNPLRFLSGLGMDLICVSTCLRHRRLIDDLKQAGTFSSARLELFVASKLQERCHCVELRPELPNHKRADLLTKEDGLSVYFEMKQLSLSDAHRAVEQLSRELMLSIARLQSLRDQWPKDAGYEIVISESTRESLGSGDALDEVFIAELVEMTMSKMKAGLTIRELPFEFNVQNYVNVRVGVGLTSQISGPVYAPEPELKRVLQKHFSKPNQQLHPEVLGFF